MNVFRFSGFSAEFRIVTLVAATQFVSALEFIILLPLGPDLARGLAMNPSHLGYLTSAYGIAAFVSGLGSASILDSFDRRKALGVSVSGLVIATALCGLAPNMACLLLARFLAGAFAGPVAAVGLALISDLIPAERRGRAVTTLITAGSIASIVGVPAGITLAQAFGWRTPFLVIAAAGAAILWLMVKALPSMTGHLALATRETLGSKARMMTSPVGLVAMAATILSAASGFVVIANIPIQLQSNLHIPASAFAGLYLAGGCTAFVVTRMSGRVIDRFGSWPVMLASNLLFASVVWELFVRNAVSLPVVVLFVGSMTANALRNAALQTALTRIPPPSRRAAFLSVTGSMTQLGSALGAGGSSLFLYQTADAAVGGMDRLGWIAIALTATLTPTILLLNGSRRQRANPMATGEGNGVLPVSAE